MVILTIVEGPLMVDAISDNHFSPWAVHQWCTPSHCNRSNLLPTCGTLANG